MKKIASVVLFGVMNVYAGFQGTQDVLNELQESLANFRAEIEKEELATPSKNEPAGQPQDSRIVRLEQELKKAQADLSKEKTKHERATRLVNEYTKVMRRQEDELEEKNKEIRSCKARLLKAEATLNSPTKSK